MLCVPTGLSSYKEFSFSSEAFFREPIRKPRSVWRHLYRVFRYSEKYASGNTYLVQQIMDLFEARALALDETANFVQSGFAATQVRLTSPHENSLRGTPPHEYWVTALFEKTPRKGVGATAEQRFHAGTARRSRVQVSASFHRRIFPKND